MQKRSTTKKAGQITSLIGRVTGSNVAIVITTIITAQQSACNCYLMVYNKDDICEHQMKFQLNANETIFIDSKLILTEGDSLKVQSLNLRGEASDCATFTVMYDQSENI